MNTGVKAAGILLLVIVSFLLGFNTYYPYLSWYFGTDSLSVSSVDAMMLSNVIQGAMFALSGIITFIASVKFKKTPLSTAKALFTFIVTQLIVNFLLFSAFVGLHKVYNRFQYEGLHNIDITNVYFVTEIILSAIFSIMFMSTLYDKFFYKNHKNGVCKSV
ncbi:hypothetical protein HC231_01585 [Brenneria izadpanahii]|uniref:DUF4149 domain-containing protein n=1 Tax=Brenneria izadpanahii TaxID=2722756 RepID=A0ABX7UQE2_9GAMM|nr:hypothetical protein [Brenneria izadpanahii]QTF06767.1 hypothetical protein HC231_01585 [Brenneria izadpanahii]